MKPVSIELIVTLCALLPLAVQAAAVAGEPYPRVSEEGYKARLPFFDYDTSLPLDGHIVQEWDSKATVRQKIVFRGAQGRLVPGFVEVPKDAKKPYPLVLLVHGWSGSKQVWWEDTGIHHGGLMRKALLKAGCAVLALDAATHGERSSEIDYQHVNPYDDPKAPPTHNYFTYAEIAVQTTKDYRRALDYVTQRFEVDPKRIGLVGYSMGGMDAFYLMAVEPRIKTFVACVPPLYQPGYGPTSPIDYTWGARGKSLLMIMGRMDELGDPAKVQASYDRYIAGPTTKLIWLDRDHDLGPGYVPLAQAWIEAHL